MRTGSLSSDDLLLAHLRAPPDLDDGVESLRYWRDRTDVLPWYRFQARREAREMTRRWEQRVRAAVFSQRRVALGARMSAGLLLAQLHFRRSRLRAVAVGVAGIAAAIVAVPFALVVLVLIQIF